MFRHPVLAAPAALLFAVLCILPANLSAADCQNGERPLSAAESRFFGLLTDVQAFLPQPPPEWRVVDTTADGPSSLCRDRDELYLAGKASLSGSASYTFQRQTQPGDAERLAAHAGLPPADRQRMEELKKEISDLLARANQAVKDNDEPEMERLRAELDRRNETMDALKAKEDAAIQEALRREAKDYRALVRATLNAPPTKFPCSSMVPLEVKGPVQAFRLVGPAPVDPRNPDLLADGVTVVLYGPWTTSFSDGVFLAGSRFRPGAPHTEIQTILLEFRGNQASAEELLKGTMVEGLAGFLGK